jgi:hypothetical protein
MKAVSWMVRAQSQLSIVGSASAGRRHGHSRLWNPANFPPSCFAAGLTATAHPRPDPPRCWRS